MTTKCAKFNVVLLRQLEYRSIFWEKEYLEPNSQFFQPAWVRMFFFIELQYRKGNSIFIEGTFENLGI
jgi:hypothetical protein